MTMTAPPRAEVASAPTPRSTPELRPTRSMGPESLPPTDQRSIGFLLFVWSTAALASVAVVLYAMTPYFQQRDQRRMLAEYRVELNQAANESLTIGGVTSATTASEPGSAVGIIEIAPVQVQQVVVEGVAPSQTAVGPAHIPGTAGLGQPGNAALVARRAMFAGPFADIGALRQGDQILVTTKQGQSVYRVELAGDHVIDDLSASAKAEKDLYASAEGPKDPFSESVVRAQDVFGPTKDDRLTLVTSASMSPTNRSAATIVVAKLQGKPFPPTPQGGRIESQTGRSGDASAWAPLVLALLFFAGCGAAAVVQYRRSSVRVAYLLTAAPLIVATIVVAETASRILPAWA